MVTWDVPTSEGSLVIHSWGLGRAHPGPLASGRQRAGEHVEGEGVYGDQVPGLILP